MASMVGGPAASNAQAVSITPALVAGLDHVVVGVNDLEAAAARYRDLGFALKPGRAHDNGIRNQHVKFTNGTELELLTAPAARDDLTSFYRQHLTAGDGPAFMALYAPDRQALAKRLANAKSTATYDGGSVGYPRGDRLHYIFFFGRNQSPTDRPEHFAHENTAQSLAAVWLAADDFSTERALFTIIGGTVDRRMWPGNGAFDAVTLGDDRIYLLPAARQVITSRTVVGATMSVRSLAAAERVLTEHGITWTRGGPSGGDTLLLAPAVTFGIWLELQENRSAR
jgi:hypothetical protein